MKVNLLKAVLLKSLRPLCHRRIPRWITTTRHVGEPFDNVSEIEDVIAAYRLILGRNPEKAGFDHYKTLIKSGLPVDRLVFGFINSEEYKRKKMDEEGICVVDCGRYYVVLRKGEQDFGRTIVEFKTWEPHIVAVLSEILKEGNTFIDVGANVGVMTFFGAKAVGRSGRVVAVEPNPDNLQLLYAGILENNFENVHVLPLAASDKIHIFSLAGGTSNTYLTHPKSGKYYVQSILLDDALKDLSSIDVVKVDVEGHEPHALNGFRTLLKRHKPLVLMEFNPRCLRDVSGLDPGNILEMVFDMFEDIYTVELSGKRTRFRSATELWRYWEDKNADAVKTGWLPDGMLHFDILARAK